MGLVLVTFPSGKEEAAKLEALDCIFREDPDASFLPQTYPGLLLLNTKLSSDRAAALIRECPTAYICRVIPVDFMIISELPSIIDAVIKLMPKTPTRVRIECVRRGRHIRSSKDVESAVGSALVSLGHTINISSPETLVRIDIIGELTTISVGSPDRYAKKLRDIF